MENKEKPSFLDNHHEGKEIDKLRYQKVLELLPKYNMKLRQAAIAAGFSPYYVSTKQFKEKFYQFMAELKGETVEDEKRLLNQILPSIPDILKPILEIASGKFNGKSVSPNAVLNASKILLQLKGLDPEKMTPQKPKASVHFKFVANQPNSTQFQPSSEQFQPLNPLPPEDNDTT